MKKLLLLLIMTQSFTVLAGTLINKRTDEHMSIKLLEDAEVHGFGFAFVGLVAALLASKALASARADPLLNSLSVLPLLPASPLLPLPLPLSFPERRGGGARRAHAPEVADPAARVADRRLEVDPTHLVLVLLRGVLAACLGLLLGGPHGSDIHGHGSCQG